MSEKKIPYKIYLEESEMPKTWYNVRADNARLFAYFVKPIIKRVSRAQRIAVGRGVC